MNVSMGFQQYSPLLSMCEQSLPPFPLRKCQEISHVVRPNRDTLFLVIREQMSAITRTVHCH